MTTTTAPAPVADEKLTAPLAILGGEPIVPEDPADESLFHWPIVTDEDKQAVWEVIERGAMSGLDVTQKFEAEIADWLGVKYALGYPNGTMALLSAMWSLGLRRGDEMICPSITYWASAMPCLGLGATPVFADVDPKSLCITPSEIERLVTPRTKAIVAVHYCGHPCDMDPIMDVAHRHGLKVIEDVSHAQGTLYKGRLCGSMGHVAAMSMMGGKSFAIGEGGMLATNDPAIHEAAIAFAHYERHAKVLTSPHLAPLAGLPLGGVKGRLNQTCAAMGRVQLKHYTDRITQIQAGLNRFWDLLEDVPGLKAHRPDDADSTMGGWYNPVGLYVPEELGGLPVEKFIDAVQAEGGRSGRGVNFPLHSHPVMQQADIYGDGRPTRIAFADRDLREKPGDLPISEGVAERAFGVPWFKHDRPERIAQFAAAFRKVALQADKLNKS